MGLKIFSSLFFGCVRKQHLTARSRMSILRETRRQFQRLNVKAAAYDVDGYHLAVDPLCGISGLSGLARDLPDNPRDLRQAGKLSLESFGKTSHAQTKNVVSLIVTRDEAGLGKGVQQMICYLFRQLHCRADVLARQ